jgi:hypothetical protein
MADRTIKCDRWDECQRRDEEVKKMIDALNAEKREDHREIWDAIRETNSSVMRLAVSVSGLNGKMAGYIVAGSILSGALLFVATYVFKHV